MTEQIQIVVVEPFTIPYKKTIPNTLEAMQQIVDGYIENVFIGRSPSGSRLAIVVNEEGLLRELPWNRNIIGGYPLVGTFFVTSYNMEGDNCSLSDAVCDAIIEKFSYPNIEI